MATFYEFVNHIYIVSVYYSMNHWEPWFICGMVLWCAGTLNPRIESGSVTADMSYIADKCS